MDEICTVSLPDGVWTVCGEETCDGPLIQIINPDDEVIVEGEATIENLACVIATVLYHLDSVYESITRKPWISN